jgi:hypothetical protein
VWCAAMFTAVARLCNVEHVVTGTVHDKYERKNNPPIYYSCYPSCIIDWKNLDLLLRVLWLF